MAFTATSTTGRTFTLAEATSFDLDLPQFVMKTSEYVVYTAADAETNELVGYLVRGRHTDDFTGKTETYWRVARVGTRRLTPGVKQRPTALKRLG